MNRSERRKRTQRICNRRRKLAEIRNAQGYYSPVPDVFSDGYFRNNNFLCHYYGSIKVKRKFRQQVSKRYWKSRPHTMAGTMNYSRNELRQIDRMDSADMDFKETDEWR